MAFQPTTSKMPKRNAEDEVICIGVRSPGGELRPEPKAPKAPKPKPAKLECSICYSEKPVTSFEAFDCGHTFCTTCKAKMRFCPLKCGSAPLPPSTRYPNMIP